MYFPLCLYTMYHLALPLPPLLLLYPSLTASGPSQYADNLASRTMETGGDRAGRGDRQETEVTRGRDRVKQKERQGTDRGER